MKRFFLFSVSCLILAVACLVFFQAFHSDANAQGNVPYFRVLGSSGSGVHVAVGENVYYLGSGQLAWEHMAVSDLPPVPVSSLVYYNYFFAITDVGEGWLHTHNYSVWENIGLVPPDAVNTQKSSLGGVKGLYK
jgi:hypothetical protein